jgi:hypothetical protein
MNELINQSASTNTGPFSYENIGISMLHHHHHHHHVLYKMSSLDYRQINKNVEITNEDLDREQNDAAVKI